MRFSLLFNSNCGLTWLKVSAIVMLWSFSISEAYATQSNEGEREARSHIYWFGEGYASALIGQTVPTKVTKSKGGDLIRKEARHAGAIVSWVQSTSHTGKPVLEKLRVSQSRHLVGDIYIGETTAAEIRKRFGDPGATGKDWLTYQGLAEICSDSFTFKFHGNKLKEVEWQWCWD